MANKDITVRENLNESDRERYNEIGQASGVYGKAVIGYAPYAASPFTGQITVAAAGSEEVGPNVSNDNGFMLTAHPDNTDTSWVFTAGSDKNSGYPLSVSPQNAFIAPVPNLNYLGFDVDVSGEKICWMKL